MKKSTWIKRAVATFLVVFMSIESFAAIVGDNDGAAFITKAEFDSMKNDFQSQLDRYNSSLDNKIDGAIASYLAGVRIQGKPTNLFGRLKSVIGNKNPYFFNSCESGSDSITTQVSVLKKKNYSTKYEMPSAVQPLLTQIKYKVNASQVGSCRLYLLYTKSDGTSTGLWNTGSQMNPTVGSYFVLSFYAWQGETIRYNCGGVVDKWSPTIEAGDTKEVIWPAGNYTWSVDYDKVARGTSVNLMGYFPNLKQSVGISSNIDDAGSAPPSDAGGTINFEVNSIVSDVSSRNGAGSQWVYNNNPDGSKSLNAFWSTFYLSQNIILNYKTFKDYGNIGTAVEENVLDDDNICTFSPSITPAYGKVTYGTDYSSYNTQNHVGYIEEYFSSLKSSTDVNDYRTAQWGIGTTRNIYVSTESPILYTTSTLLNAYTDLATSSVVIGGATHNTTKVTNNVYEVIVSPEAAALNTFVNTYYSGIAGETVKMGYGLPIMQTNGDDIVRYTITIPIKQTVAPAGSVAASGQVTARLSLNHFTDGNFSTASDKVWEGTIDCDSYGVGTVTFTVDGIPKGQQLWINLYGDTANRKVELTDFIVSAS